LIDPSCIAFGLVDYQLPYAKDTISENSSSFQFCTHSQLASCPLLETCWGNEENEAIAAALFLLLIVNFFPSVLLDNPVLDSKMLC